MSNHIRHLNAPLTSFHHTKLKSIRREYRSNLRARVWSVNALTFHPERQAQYINAFVLDSIEILRREYHMQKPRRIANNFLRFLLLKINIFYSVTVDSRQFLSTNISRHTVNSFSSRKISHYKFSSVQDVNGRAVLKQSLGSH